MCLAIPALVVALHDNAQAVVDLGGIRKEISVALVADVQAHLQILACRAKPTGRHPAKPSVDALWAFLTQKNKHSGQDPVPKSEQLGKM